MPRLFRITLPVSNTNRPAEFYSTLLATPGKRVSPGRHYFPCGGTTILACFDLRADGDNFDAKPNPDHLYFAVQNLDELFRLAQHTGCREIDPAIQTRPCGERSFYAHDPFGNPIYFVDDKTLFIG